MTTPSYQGYGFWWWQQYEVEGACGGSRVLTHQLRLGSNRMGLVEYAVEMTRGEMRYSACGEKTVY